MRYVPRPAAPLRFKTWAVGEFNRVSVIFQKPGAFQHRTSFSPLEKAPEALEVLLRAFSNKCAYCERRIGVGQEFGKSDLWAVLDRFRPAGGAVDLKGKVSPRHYWWLAYEWENFYPCCGECDEHKGNRFPLTPKRQRLAIPSSKTADAPTQPWDELEAPLLISPSSLRKPPEVCLRFHRSGKVEGIGVEGRVTIQLLALNRTNLIQHREKVASALYKRFPGMFGLLKSGNDLTRRGGLLQEVSEEQEFLGMRRRFVSIFIQQVSKMRGFNQKASEALERFRAAFLRSIPEGVRGAYGEYKEQGLVGSEQPQSTALAVQRIEWVHLKDFKGIQDLKVKFPKPSAKGSWMVLLGTNASGKSSILQAIALTLMGQEARDKLCRRLDLDARIFLRRTNKKRGPSKGSVQVKLDQTEKPIKLTFSRASRRFSGSASPSGVYTLGYGSTRLLPRGYTQVGLVRGNSRVDNLFDPHRSLVDAEQWLIAAQNRNEFDLAARGILDLLPVSARETLTVVTDGKEKKVFVNSPTSSVPMDSWSDGFQSIVGLATDILAFMRRRSEIGVRRMEDARGILLIDELENHLHPRWKMEVVRKLRTTFPHLQFIVTTHDPLCLKGLEDSEVAVLRKGTNGRVGLIPELPSPKGLRADQLLTSEYFSLDSTVDPQLEMQFKRYYELLSLKARTPEQQTALDDLQKSLQEHEHFGKTTRDRMVYEIVDAFMSKVLRSTVVSTRRDLKEKMIRKGVRVLETRRPDGTVTR